MKTRHSRLAALAILAGNIPTAGAVMASEPPMIVPGGELDPAFPNADVYIGIPKAAAASSARACVVAQHYVDLINAGDYAGVARLFGDDATFLEPVRPTLRGRAQIDEFYTKRIGSMKPQIIAVSYLGDDAECMITLTREIEIGGRQRYVLVSVDHFLIGDDGKIVSMAAFARPERG